VLPETAAYDVLHALVVKGMAQAEPLAASTARDPENLRQELERLRSEGLATHLEQRRLWRVTPEGRARHAELMDGDLTSEDREGLRPAYERFLPVNLRFKQTCTRWQLHGNKPNDHTDTAYDQALIADLGKLHEETAPLLTELAEVRGRFARYSGRLADALARVRGGDVKAFTGVMCESYHDIWMELHRDLLICLKVDRDAEQRAAR
jgi:hypothetical protein